MNKKPQFIKTIEIEGEKIQIRANIRAMESFKVIDEEKGIFEAYVSVFGNVDSYGEIVDKGAFKEWLEKYAGRYPKGVWAHDWNEPIIKTIECREDDRGLYVKGQFVLEVQRAREIYALMKEGVITDFSFGFRVQEDSWDEVNNVRHLKKIAIYEYSPVLVGANEEATLLGVKTAIKEVENEGEGETTPETEEAPDEPEEGEGGEDAAETDELPKEDTEGEDEPASVEEDAPTEDPGKGIVPLSKTALAKAIGAMKEATSALEALNEATEDESQGKGSDTSQVEPQDGKDGKQPGKTVLRAILRDARKADKANEAVILRAKSLLSGE